MGKGIPYAEAMSMTPARRLAFIVAFGEFEGRKFNWRSLKFEDVPA